MIESDTITFCENKVADSLKTPEAPKIDNYYLDSVNQQIDDINSRKVYIGTSNLIENSLKKSTEFVNNTFNNTINLPKRNFFVKQRMISHSEKTQRWVGYITAISGVEFSARLEDLNDPGTYEVADFEIKEVSKSDKELLSVGAVFYWSVGYSNDNGQVSKKSLIRFKRTVPFTEDEVNEVVDWADKMIKGINWD